MTMENRCYCRGDDITSLELNKPEHLMPMMRPFSMRISNLEAAIKNLYTCGLLSDYLFHGDGNLLVRLWRNTCPNHIVHLLEIKNIPPDIKDFGFG